MKIKFAFVCLSLLVTLSFVELLVRVSHLWVPQNNLLNNHFQNSQSLLFPYTYRPRLDRYAEGIHLQTNSLGLKDRREPTELEEKCFRILMVGGSVTAGFGVDNQDAIPQQLERELNQAGTGCYQVINAGQIGYSAADIAGLLKFLTPLYRPRLIIFSLNKFVMDDSRTVGAENTLTSQQSGSFAFDYLKSNWSMDGKYLDLERPYLYDPQHPSLDIADPHRHAGKWYASSHAFLYFYPHFWNLLEKLGLSSSPVCPSSNCLDLKPVYVDSAGRVERLPRYSALYYSPYLRRRFYSIINQTAEAAERENIPLVFMSMDFFIEPAKVSSSRAVFTDIAEVSGMTAKELFERHNLVWDFHLTPRGNAIVAGGLKSFLAERGLVNLTEDRPSPGRHFEEYVNAQRAQQQVHLQQFFSWIDIKKRRNLHQILGGIHPIVRGFFRRSAFLLKKTGQTKIKIDGEVFGRIKSRIRLRIYSGEKETADDFELSPGNFSVEHRLGELADGLLDVQLFCRQEICDIRYDAVALE